MQFLKTLFWVVVTVVVVLFSKANWFPVSVKLWGGLEADVKLPLILFIGISIGFLPTYLLHRARLWSIRRRIEPLERTIAVQAPAQPATSAPDAGERVATDSKAWPAT